MSSLVISLIVYLVIAVLSLILTIVSISNNPTWFDWLLIVICCIAWLLVLVVIVFIALDDTNKENKLRRLDSYLDEEYNKINTTE